ncbi:MAG: endonuclease III [Nanoarchaeota archaeon]
MNKSEGASKAIKQLNKIDKLTDSSLRLAAEFNTPWQALISIMLSPMTRDETTIEISEKLYKKYHSLNKLSKASLNEIKKIIKPVNYYKTKSKHILQTAKILIKEQKGKIPSSREELMKLPGVGRKVANVYLVHVHKTAAIGVDTHLAQTSRKLGWTNEKNPYKIEKDLEKLFPKKYWNKINYIVVRFGREYSKKQKNKILKDLRKI